MRTFSIILAIVSTLSLFVNKLSADPLYFGPHDACELNLSVGTASGQELDHFAHLSNGLKALYSSNIRDFELNDRVLFIRNALEVFNKELEFSRIFMRDKGTKLITESAKLYSKKVFGTEQLDQQHFLIAMIYWLDTLSQDPALPVKVVQEIFLSMASTFWDWKETYGPTKYSLVMDAAEAFRAHLFERFDEYLFQDQDFLKDIWYKFYLEYSTIGDTGLYGHEKYLNRLFIELFNEKFPFSENFTLKSGAVYSVFSNYINIRIRNLDPQQRRILNVGPHVKEVHCRLFRGQKIHAEIERPSFSDTKEDLWKFTVLTNNPGSPFFSQGELQACPKNLVIISNGVPDIFAAAFHL